MKLRFWNCAVALLLCGQLAAQTPDRQALVSALQAGGHVIVLRHTSSPRDLPAEAERDPANVRGERQLDAVGRADAQAFGAALRRLAVPMGEVKSSPAFRALETARLAGFEAMTIRDELGNEGMREAGEERAAWLRSEATQVPVSGNRLLITHGPNISAAFPDLADGMEEGDALVFNAADGAFVARVGIREWTEFQAP